MSAPNPTTSQVAFSILADSQPRSTRSKVAKMRAGRAQAQRRRRREAIQRVRAFNAWRQSGFGRRHMPDELPSDADFKVYREATR